MRVGYTVRAAAVMLRHPGQGVERVRGRWDRHWDRREIVASGQPASARYGVTENWAQRLHAALAVPWPCAAAAEFGQVWERTEADLTAAGARIGIASYGGWNDGDRAFGEAIWCLVAHLRPETLVETGVAHGLTSRVILEGLERNDHGHLWSVDLPAVDSALHSEIGIAVPEDLRPRWSYVQGTARERLPGLLAELGAIDLFVHDSLHTGRNQKFELESAWGALRPGGVVVVDDIDHSLAFAAFAAAAGPRPWLAARHVTGPGLMEPEGLWGLAIKSPSEPGPAGSAGQRRAVRAGGLRAIEASPHYLALRASMSSSSPRDRRHSLIELSVAREIALAIRGLAPACGRLLEIQPPHGPEVLLFREQLARPQRTVIYDQVDRRDPDAKEVTEFQEADLETGRLPAPEGHFDVVVWNRELVTVKNVMPALREVRRIIRPAGYLVLSVPNLAAAHNRLLLLAGRQPTTLHVSDGDHVRGFAVPALTRALERDLGFSVENIIGVGIAPVTGSLLPRPLRDLGHTAVWVLRKPVDGSPPAAA